MSPRSPNPKVPQPKRTFSNPAPSMPNLPPNTAAFAPNPFAPNAWSSSATFARHFVRPGPTPMALVFPYSRVKNLSPKPGFGGRLAWLPAQLSSPSARLQVLGFGTPGLDPLQNLHSRFGSNSLPTQFNRQFAPTT